MKKCHYCTGEIGISCTYFVFLMWCIWKFETWSAVRCEIVIALLLHVPRQRRPGGTGVFEVSSQILRRECGGRECCLGGRRQLGSIRSRMRSSTLVQGNGDHLLTGLVSWQHYGVKMMTGEKNKRNECDGACARGWKYHQSSGVNSAMIWREVREGWEKHWVWRKPLAPASSCLPVCAPSGVVLSPCEWLL